MHPRLEEIRQRLLTPPSPTVPSRYRALARPGSEAFSPATANAPRSSQLDSPIEEAAGEERDGWKADEQIARAMPPSSDGLAQAVGELFEPARQCQMRLVEITRASKAVTHLTRLANELREPLKSFHDNIRKLSTSFESMRTFRDELGTLAESFAPVRALHQQVAQMAYTVRVQLADVANGLEPAKAVRDEIAELTAAIDSLSELQARFYELSEAFGDAGASNRTSAAFASSNIDVK